MDFNFPTMTKEPSVIVNYKSGNLSQTQKQFEDRLKNDFRETKLKCKFYLVKFLPERIEADEFNDDSYFVISNDLLAELYYSPTGDICIHYVKFQKINFKFHLENIKTN